MSFFIYIFVRKCPALLNSLLSGTLMTKNEAYFYTNIFSTNSQRNYICQVVCGVGNICDANEAHNSLQIRFLLMGVH